MISHFVSFTAHDTRAHAPKASASLVNARSRSLSLEWETPSDPKRNTKITPIDAVWFSISHKISQHTGSALRSSRSMWQWSRWRVRSSRAIDCGRADLRIHFTFLFQNKKKNNLNWLYYSEALSGRVRVLVSRSSRSQKSNAAEGRHSSRTHTRCRDDDEMLMRQLASSNVDHHHHSDRLTHDDNDDCWLGRSFFAVCQSRRWRRVWRSHLGHARVWRLFGSVDDDNYRHDHHHWFNLVKQFSLTVVECHSEWEHWQQDFEFLF